MTVSDQRVSARWRELERNGVVYVAAGGGAADLTVEQAEEFREELDQAIAAARLITSYGKLKNPGGSS